MCPSYTTQLSVKNLSNPTGHYLQNDDSWELQADFWQFGQKSCSVFQPWEYFGLTKKLFQHVTDHTQAKFSTNTDPNLQLVGIGDWTVHVSVHAKTTTNSICYMITYLDVS